MEREFLKLIDKHPEVIEERKMEIVLSHMASTLTIVLDWLIPSYGATKEDCEDLMEYVMLQLAKIGECGWDDFFEDVDTKIKEDVGFTPVEYFNEHFVGFKVKENKHEG